MTPPPTPPQKKKTRYTASLVPSFPAVLPRKLNRDPLQPRLEQKITGQHYLQSSLEKINFSFTNLSAETL